MTTGLSGATLKGIRDLKERASVEGRESQEERKGKGGNVLNYVQKVLEIEKGHGKKVCVNQNTHLHPLGGNHDPWQEV